MKTLSLLVGALLSVAGADASVPQEKNAPEKSYRRKTVKQVVQPPAPIPNPEEAQNRTNHVVEVLLPVKTVVPPSLRDSLPGELSKKNPAGTMVMDDFNFKLIEMSKISYVGFKYRALYSVSKMGGERRESQSGLVLLNWRF
ncbi:MAG: hypothetical protein ABI430_01260 [Candidatus Taylorbacteria bacterium]